MKILAFAASNSKKSINKKLVTYAASLLEKKAEIEVLDLNDYELPLFSEDKEKEIGHPDKAKNFLDKIKSSDAVIISFAEHNGSYSVAYKNIFDWCSRINPKVFQDKPLILLSTSPGARGASSVLANAEQSAPFFSGDVRGSLSIPSFYENFDVESGVIKNDKIKSQVINLVQKIL